MSESLGRLQVDLEARIAKFESDMGRAARILQRDMVRGAQASERAIRQMRQSSERDMERIRNSARSATTAVIAFFSIQQGARLAASLGRVADQYANIQAKVRLAAGENANLTASMDRVFGVAQRTFNTLDGTAALVQRGANALQNFGQTADVAFSNALQLAEIFNKSLVVSGASSQEAASAALQFSQALASGKFSGDEFRSVMENNSRFAQLLADSLGVTIAELRTLSKEGKLTTSSFIDLIGKTGTLDAQFAKMPLTIGRAKTQLDNAFTKFIGEGDRAYGTSRLVASGLSALAQNLGPVVSGLGQLAIVAVGAFAGRSVQALQGFTRALIERAKAEQLARVATAERMQTEAAANALALTRARSEQLTAQATAASAAAERAKAETQLATMRAQEMVIRANALRATSEIEMARLSIQLTALEKERAVATAALGAARQRQVAVNVALATSNRTLAAAEVAAGVAGAQAGAKISMGMRAGQIATAAMTVAGRSLASAMAFLGGPIGVAIIAVTSLGAAFYGAARKAEDLKRSAQDALKAVNAAVDSKSRLAAQQAGEALIAERELQRDRLRDLEFVKGGGVKPSVGLFTGKQLNLEIANQKQLLGEIDRQLALNTKRMQEYSDSQGTAAAATSTVSDELTKEAERLTLQRIELTKGLRARLEYEEIKKAGVRNASELSAATRATIDQIVAESAAIDGVKDARREGAKAARSAAAEERRDARERAQAQKQFQADIERLAASMGGEYAKANIAYQQSLRDIKGEFEAGGATVEQYRRQQELLKEQFDDTVAGIKAGVQGPLAAATYEYSRALKQLREDAAATGVTETDLAEAEKQLGREFARTTKEIHERMDPVGALLQDMQFELDLLGKTNAERVVANELRRIGVGLSEEEKRAAAISIQAHAEMLEAQHKQIAAMDEFRQNMKDNVAGVLDGSKTIKEAFDDMVSSLVAQVARLLANQWVDKFFGAEGTSSPSGGFLGIFSSLFGGSSSTSSSSNFGIPGLTGLLPGFAGGTEYAPGGLAIVGEDGPEVVNLPRGSQVIPNHRMRGGLTVNQNFVLSRDTSKATQQQTGQRALEGAQRAFARNS